MSLEKKTGAPAVCSTASGTRLCKALATPDAPVLGLSWRLSIDMFLPPQRPPLPVSIISPWKITVSVSASWTLLVALQLLEGNMLRRERGLLRVSERQASGELRAGGEFDCEMRSGEYGVSLKVSALQQMYEKSGSKDTEMGSHM